MKMQRQCEYCFYYTNEELMIKREIENKEKFFCSKDCLDRFNILNEK